MYSHPVTVEFEDVDCYGIVHHTKLIAYLERARVHFFVDSKLDLHSIKVGLVLRHMEVQFKQPLLLMDRVIVELRVKMIDKLRFVWNYRIVKEGKLCVKAEIEQVVINTNTMRLVAIPDSIRGLLENLLVRSK